MSVLDLAMPNRCDLFYHILCWYINAPLILDKEKKQLNLLGTGSYDKHVTNQSILFYLLN